MTEAFRIVAEEYCRWVEANAGQVADAAEVGSLLARLYTEALRLPDAQPSEDGERAPSPERPQAPLVGNQDYYWEVFNPFLEDDLVIGSLCDDVLDIYVDLKGPLLMLEQNPGWLGAVWSWRFAFYSHWGAHLTNAMRAVHTLVTDPEADLKTREQHDQG